MVCLDKVADAEQKKKAQEKKQAKSEPQKDSEKKKHRNSHVTAIEHGAWCG